MTSALVHIVTAALLMLGFAGVFLPVLPGVWLAWTGLLFAHVFAPEVVGLAPVIVFGVLCALAQLFDFLSTVWGVKKFGGTWRGMLGSMVGLFAGLFLFAPLAGVGAFVGMIIGAAVGAISGEMLGGADWRAAVKAGVGTLIGWFASLVVRVTVVAAMIAWFAVALIWKAFE